ncbi:hypothetical protein LJC63_12275 [Ruminococcaceae bacterium OttesenSCG-928-L11]|nr:hypothetical protein [Ruminococcaceae bacterium OttesenSCG-928-L11]
MRSCNSRRAAQYGRAQKPAKPVVILTGLADGIGSAYGGSHEVIAGILKGVTPP